MVAGVVRDVNESMGFLPDNPSIRLWDGCIAPWDCRVFGPTLSSVLSFPGLEAKFHPRDPNLVQLRKLWCHGFAVVWLQSQQTEFPTGSAGGQRRPGKKKKKNSFFFMHSWILRTLESLLIDGSMMCPICSTWFEEVSWSTFLCRKGNLLFSSSVKWSAKLSLNLSKSILNRPRFGHTNRIIFYIFQCCHPWIKPNAVNFLKHFWGQFM